jgi:hypothetical protein
MSKETKPSREKTRGSQVRACATRSPAPQIHGEGQARRTGGRSDRQPARKREKDDSFRSDVARSRPRGKRPLPPRATRTKKKAKMREFPRKELWTSTGHRRRAGQGARGWTDRGAREGPDGPSDRRGRAWGSPIPHLVSVTSNLFFAERTAIEASRAVRLCERGAGWSFRALAL